MAIIYTYPTKSTPADDDKILISDSEDSNKTKQVTIEDIRTSTAGVTKIIAGQKISISPTNGIGDVTITSLPPDDNISGTGEPGIIPRFSGVNTLAGSMLQQDAAANNMTFASGFTSGKSFLITGTNKIAFDSDSTNTFIAATTTNPEALEIHADDKLYLRPDNYVVIDGAAAPVNPDDPGDRGSIAYDNNYIYIAVQDDEWKRAALTTW